MSKESNTLAKAEMMIRRPVAEVFEAFINPEITTKFWFTHSSGKLEEGKKVDWIWEMYHLTVPVQVKSIELNKRILVEWGTGDHQSTVEWIFKSLTSSKTFVKITNYDFKGTEHELTSKVIDSTGGFTLVIAGLKAWLEHKIELQLIGDKHPMDLLQK